MSFRDRETGKFYQLQELLIRTRSMADNVDAAREALGCKSVAAMDIDVFGGAR
ncbi:hypothetical protein [Hyphomicrobium sp.]|uniref:hypothetical protein n=1 Tax=Hyphomicrobium sp. TaxID=82 RepID=UPI001D1D3DBB|nr:hypothetical protein [Hyphomicrobium sp.]MBY0561414.1 hypothetical protein [Hyphomicrobium sp.]